MQNFNAEKIVAMHNDATAEMEELRKLLRADITRYRNSWIYKRRMRAWEADDQQPKHPRLIDVDNLETIVNAQKLTVELVQKTETYLRNRANFRFAKASPLRTRLLRSLKKIRRSNDLPLIDSHIQLLVDPHAEMIPVPVPREADGTDTATTYSMTDEMEQVMGMPMESLAVKGEPAMVVQRMERHIGQLESEIEQKDNVIAGMRLELTQKQTKVNQLTIHVQERDRVLATMQDEFVRQTQVVEQLQKHVEVRDLVIERKNSTIEYKNAYYRFLKMSFTTYVEKTFSVFTALGDALTSVSNLLRKLLHDKDGKKLRDVVRRELANKNSPYSVMLSSSQPNITKPLEKFLVQKQDIQQIIDSGNLGVSDPNEIDYEAALKQLPKVEPVIARVQWIPQPLSAEEFQPDELSPPPPPPFDLDQADLDMSKYATVSASAPPPPPQDKDHVSSGKIAKTVPSKAIHAPAKPKVASAVAAVAFAPPPPARPGPPLLSANPQAMVNQLGQNPANVAKPAAVESLLDQLKTHKLKKAVEVEPVKEIIPAEDLTSQLSAALNAMFGKARGGDEEINNDDDGSFSP